MGSPEGLLSRISQHLKFSVFDRGVLPREILRIQRVK